MSQNIFLQYLVWHFFEAPKNILKGWRNLLKFNLNYFSIFPLLKTFFSPYKRYGWQYPRGFDFGKYLEVFFSNLISRILGAFARTIFIVAGLLTEILIIFAGLIVISAWLALPVLLASGLIFGFKILI